MKERDNHLDGFNYFSFDQLEYEKPPRGRVVSLKPHNGLDQYNPSNAFLYNGERYHAVREEPRDNDFDYQTRFFKELTPDNWQLDTTIPALPLQDPFITKIYNEIVVGGVQYRPGELYTTFYKGSSLEDLKEFAHGPSNQKDIRLSETQDGRVAILTRPWVWGRGRIGFDVIPSLDFLNPDTILKAPLLSKQPNNDEWWGSNDAQLLPNGDIGVIGHIAKRNNGLHYAPIAFTVSLTREMTTPKILARRSDFPYTEAKRSELEDVVFSAGIKEGRLYAGLSDTAIGVIDIPNPFNI